MAKISTATFKGLSRKTYSFNVYPIDTEFKPSGAVYCITRRFDAGGGNHQHKIIYVGVTGDLSTRFDDHHKDDCFRHNSANCICIHADDVETSRFAKERDLIDGCDPICNG